MPRSAARAAGLTAFFRLPPPRRTDPQGGPAGGQRWRPRPPAFGREALRFLLRGGRVLPASRRQFKGHQPVSAGRAMEMKRSFHGPCRQIQVPGRPAEADLRFQIPASAGGCRPVPCRLYRGERRDSGSIAVGIRLVPVFLSVLLSLTSPFRPIGGAGPPTMSVRRLWPMPKPPARVGRIRKSHFGRAIGKRPWRASPAARTLVKSIDVARDRSQSRMSFSSEIREIIHEKAASGAPNVLTAASSRRRPTPGRLFL